MTGPPPRRPGRPCKWADEAERSRAYRARRAEALADPSRLRDDLRAAQDDARQSATAAHHAQRDAARWQRRAETRPGPSRPAHTERLHATKAAIRELRAERDQARRALADKLAYAGDARALRDDPDSLLALVAELRAELADTHHELTFLRDMFNAAGNQPRQPVDGGTIPRQPAPATTTSTPPASPGHGAVLPSPPSRRAVTPGCET